MENKSSKISGTLKSFVHEKFKSIQENENLLNYCNKSREFNKVAK